MSSDDEAESQADGGHEPAKDLCGDEFLNVSKLSDPILPLPSIPREKPLPVPHNILERMREGPDAQLRIHERKF